MRNAFILVLGLAAACGKPPELPPPAERKFSADPRPEGAALWIQAEVQEREAAIEVWGHGLGSVLGYAFRVQLDGVTVARELSVEEAMGPNAPGEAVYLAKGLAAGAARQGAAAGEKAVDADTKLATLRVALSDDPGALRLTDSAVRRATGERVQVTLAGGTFNGSGR